jgi:hypothetical protein
MTNNPLVQPLPLNNLRISTNIPLHSGFFEAPLRFASQHGVRLANEVFTETSFKLNPNSRDPYYEEKLKTVNANVHLTQHGAIRLLIERDGTRDWVRSIDLNPSLLLHGAKNQPLLDSDLPLSLCILRDAVAPLLADPLDARHIVPGLPGKGAPVAYWSAMGSEILLPGIHLRCLHRLSHPFTGPAQGATKNRIRLGDNSDNCVIEFTAAKSKRSRAGGKPGVDESAGIRVRLILKGRTLPSQFRQHGKTNLIDKTERLVSFPASSVSVVHQTLMSQLEGTYLPIPTEWSDKRLGKPLTHAKAFALLAEITSMPLKELRSIDEDLRALSDSTRKRLSRDVGEATRCLTPVPVSTLFSSSLYSDRASGMASRVDEPIDPDVATAYCRRS